MYYKNDTLVFENQSLPEIIVETIQEIEKYSASSWFRRRWYSRKGIKIKNLLQKTLSSLNSKKEFNEIESSLLQCWRHEVFPTNFFRKYFPWFYWKIICRPYTPWYTVNHALDCCFSKIMLHAWDLNKSS